MKKTTAAILNIITWSNREDWNDKMKKLKMRDKNYLFQAFLLSKIKPDSWRQRMSVMSMNNWKTGFEKAQRTLTTVVDLVFCFEVALSDSNKNSSTDNFEDLLKRDH